MYNITKDDEVMAERIEKIATRYNIVYNVDTAVYYWYDREKMVYKSGNEILFNHFILGLFNAYGTLKPIYRNKITEYATRLGIDNWQKINKNQAIQIGNQLINIKDWSSIPSSEVFNYLPIYTIEKSAIYGDPINIKKLIHSWGQNWEFFIKLISYALYQKNLLKVGFVLFSHHANSGKSKFQELVAKILEYQNCYASQLEQLCDPRQRFKTANIHNKLLVSASEFSENTLLDTGVLKAMLGGDPIEGEIKRVSGYFTVHFAGLLLISTNYIPSFKNYDYALLGRLRVIEFLYSFEPKDDIFYNISEEEYQYVLWEAIEICKKWSKEGIDFEEVGNFTQRIEDNSTIMDPYFKFCKLNYIESDHENKIYLSTIKQEFLEFCEENGIEISFKDERRVSRKLSSTLQKMFPNCIKHERVLDHLGVKQVPFTGFWTSKTSKTLSPTLPSKKTLSKYDLTSQTSIRSIDNNNKDTNIQISDTNTPLPQEKLLSTLISNGDLMEIEPGVFKKVIK
jgi:hypothetical protein